MKFFLFILLSSLIIYPKITFGQAPDLGASSTFALFTAAGAFNGDPATSVVGDIGTDVGAFTPVGFLVGSIHVSDAVSAQAAGDVMIAYADLAGRTCGTVIGVTLGGGQVLTPNTYCTGAASTLNGDLTLDALGDPNAIFIFQIDGAFASTVNSTVTLINGASLCNVYWQINGQVDLGENSVFQGTIIADGAINLLAGARLFGRGLSTAGAISTNSNVVQLSGACFCVLTVTCPPAIGGTFQCIDNIPIGLPTDVTVESACGATSVSISETSSGTGCSASPFILIRTYTVTDDGGNTTDCIVTYTTIDDTPPSITCPLSLTISCLDPVPPDASLSIPTTDNCGGVVTVVLQSDVVTGQTCPNTFTILRTYVATDGCGNSASCVQTISVSDLVPPTIVCPLDLTLTCLDPLPLDASLTISTTDNCGGPVNVVLQSDVITGQTCPNTFTILRTYVATDGCGNSASCVQTISVSDLVPPTIVCPLDLTLTCLDPLPLDASPTISTTDNCGGPVNVVLQSDVVTGQICPNTFTILRTYVATDGCGNSTSCVQTISVNDLVPPTIVCPLDLTVSCLDLVPPDASLTISTTDNCGGVVTVVLQSDVITGQICPNTFTILRTYLATDGCGNSTSCVQTISVSDLVPPTIVCPLDLTISCLDLVPPDASLSISTTDNCGGLVTVVLQSDVITGQTCPNTFTILRTYVATDGCGNSASCVQTISVSDLVPPTIVCPLDLTLSCLDPLPLDASLTISTTDNCGGLVTVVLQSDVITGQTCPNTFTILRTYVATDGCGNSASCVQAISVNDLVPPTIVCPLDLTLSCLDPLPLDASLTISTTDNCGGPVNVVLQSDFITGQICPNTFTILRTYVATDGCGNSTSCVQTISVNDLVPPTIVCPLDLTISCLDLVPPDASLSISTTDNCGGLVTVVLQSDVITGQACPNTFTILRTYVATDGCGNSASCVQTISVSDLVPPTIVCPLDLTLSCLDPLPLDASLTISTTDNCGGLVTVVLQSDVITGQTCPNTFTILRTYVATDGCGNSASCVQAISVNDLVPPTIVCPLDLTLTCLDPLPLDASPTISTTDNCGGLVTVVLQSDVITGQICPNTFTILRTYLATDECGNATSCIQAISVNDLIPPTIVCPLDVTISCLDLVPPDASLTISTTDNCGGAVTVVLQSDVITGQICPNTFTILRTYLATDECGNATSCVQAISVNDLVPPTIVCPLDLTLSCLNPLPLDASLTISTTDNCGGAVTVVLQSDVVTGQTCPNNFTILRTYVATDVCGNSTSCVQVILVSDLVPPTIVCPIDVTISCLGLVPLDASLTIVPTDNCGGAVTVVLLSDVITNQTCANRFTLTRTYLATDLCGNSASCAQIITVNDVTLPTIVCPLNVTVSCAGNVPIPAPASVVTSDNCGGAVTVVLLSDVITNQTCANRFTLTRTYLATDLCGNSASCAQIITVNDVTLPTIVCPLNVTVSCAGNVPIPAPASVVTSDNCGGAVSVVLLSDVITNQTCANRFTLTRTYLATDLCGNSASCAQIITVNDMTLPTIVCPLNVTVSCVGNVPIPAPASLVTSDNCGGAVTVALLSDVITNQTCADRFTLTRTYLATDLCGNSASCAQIITVNDVTLPTIVCPLNVTVSCVGNVPIPAPASVVTSDNCGGAVTVVLLSDVVTNQTCADRFTLTRTYLATDLCGNSASCAQIITVNDVTLPTIVCPLNVTVSCVGNVPIPAPASVVTSDNCGGAVTVVLLSDVVTNQTCANRFTLTRTYLATDLCGNSASCAQIITVNDVTLPTIVCPLNVTVSCAGNVPIPAPASVVTSDNCGGAVTVVLLSDVVTNQTCANRFTLTRTYLATDLCGNSASCAQIITVNDVTLPTIVCPLNVTVSCVGNVPIPAPASVVTSDNCGGAVSVALLSDVITNQTCANRFTLTRTYLATDLCGNSASCAQIITVNDVTLPTIVCPLNVTVSCVGNVPIPAPASVVTSDNCGGAVTVVLLSDVITNQTCANRFTLTRTYLATDLCGNSASCAQIITVNDVTLPTIACPLNVTVSCVGNVPIPAPASLVTSDNCGGAVTVVLLSDVISNQTCADRFTLTRTYLATDLCGNSASCAQIITVNDVTLPTIVCPLNVTVSCASDVPLPAPTSIVSSDNCGGAVTVVHVGDVTTPGTCSNRFTITRTYQATDLCGNAASCAQIITVFDNIAPTFINPPVNLTIECFSVPPVAIPPTASDNCTGPVTVALLSEIQLPGVCPIVYILTRVWIATDDCGNTSTVSETISVQDTEAPQFVNIPVNVVLECNQVTNLNDFQDWLDTHGGATASDCSTITWTYENSPFNLDTAGCAATFRRYIRFIATDECGNSAFRDARFIIIDSTPPSFITPPQNFTVECSEGDQGEAQLSGWLENFGYSEVRDNCGEVFTEIALLSEIQGCGNTYIRTYEFRATDECGNTNYVRATFAVVDTTPPVIVSCPQGNVLLTCEFDITPPDMAGVVAWDNCSAVTVTVQSEFRYGVGCRYWPLTTAYTYAVTDECGNVSTCYQSFQVVDSIPPRYTGPDTLNIKCVDDLPGPGDINDVLAPFLVDNCYETICVGQHIEGADSNAVTFCVLFKDLCVNWADKILVTFVASGDCKPLCSATQSIWGDPGGLINGMSTTEAIEKLINKYGAVSAGDLGKTITVSSATCLQNMLPGNGNTAQFNPGTHEFSTANECHPTSVMLNSDGTLKNILAANVLAMQLNIWYNLEFNERNLGVQRMSSLPPCLVDAIVLGKLEVDHFNVQGLLNLSNDYLAGIGFYPPNFGIPLNNALENVNAYWLNCHLNDPCLNSVTVAGYLKTELQDGLEKGQVQLTISDKAGPPLTKFANSDVDGLYEFSNAVPFAGNYIVTPTAEGMVSLNGVTTYDLGLISNHILGRKPLDSPYKMIAADANRSGSITTFDITELRKLILGVYDELPNNTSWRFVDKSFVFPDLNNPFSTIFPEHKTVESLQASQMAEDFVSIKIGDVDGTALANSLMGTDERSAGTLLFDLDDRSVTLGETFQVKLTADQIVQGYQFTLNTDGLEVLEVSGEGMNAGNFAVFAEEAAMTTSWNLPEGTTDGIAAITLKLRATQSGRLSKMLSLSSRITKALAYGEQNQDWNDPMALDIALRFHDESGTMISSTGFELYQNVPNPFVDKTTIGFYLPEATEAILTMYDETGRLVYSQKGDFARGYNVFEIVHPLTKTNGTLLYKVETATDRATKKMIQTK